ncbi:MAG: hypothetical protein QOD06_1671, partial [Candidatus Binatota bacterium]|nr:hypothetical protein [Candidatus Binatota bacterium]
ADTLPFAANRLPQRERARVVQLSLLGLSSAADFEIHVSDWLGTGPRADSLPVVPELRKLDPSRIQCFYGEQEDDTLCRAPALATAEVIRTGGGHHFDGDYTALAAKILAGARRRSATESSSRAQDAAVLPPRPTGSTTRAQPPAMSAATSPVIRGHSQARR